MPSDEDNGNSENPFEVSQVLGDTTILQTAYASPYDFDLKGDLIVCGSHLILPPICVHTGATEDLVEVQRHTVFPSMRLVVHQKSCYVVTFIAKSEQAHRMKTAAMHGAIMTVGLMLMGAACLMNQKQGAILLPFGLVIVGVSFFRLHRQNFHLTLVSYKAPGIYWVRGFPQAFLARLATYKLNVIGANIKTQRNRHEAEI